MPESLLRLRISVAVLGGLAGLSTAAFAYDYAVDPRLSRVDIENRSAIRSAARIDGIAVNGADEYSKTTIKVDNPASVAVVMGEFQLTFEVVEEMQFQRLHIRIEDPRDQVNPN